jgi:hypothetical protein
MKKTVSPYASVLAIGLSAMMCIPNQLGAAPDTPGQRAGEVSRVIPTVSIARGAKSVSASPKTVVGWQDVVNTQASARARVALDDCSVLNVGSDSSIKVVKHDGGAQQTELELAYGKIRTQAQKITKPDGKFDVKTPAGVAGVVGTDFYVAFDNASATMNVIVFEGLVKVCNLAGVCVIVKAGQMTNVRSNDTSGPQAPTQAGLNTLVDAGTATDVGGRSETGVQKAGHPLGTGNAIAIGILVVIPAIVIPILATRGSKSQPPPQPKGCGNNC